MTGAAEAPSAEELLAERALMAPEEDESTDELLQLARGRIAGRPIVIVSPPGLVDLSGLRAEGPVVIETVDAALLVKHLRHALRAEPYEPAPSWSMEGRRR